jgi:3-isopropylmalate dehydrogenase
MLLRHSLGLTNEAEILELAAIHCIENGVRTPDIAEPGARIYSTHEVGDAIIAALTH